MRPKEAVMRRWCGGGDTGTVCELEASGEGRVWYLEKGDGSCHVLNAGLECGIVCTGSDSDSARSFKGDTDTIEPHLPVFESGFVTIEMCSHTSGAA